LQFCLQFPFHLGAERHDRADKENGRHVSSPSREFRSWLGDCFSKSCIGLLCLQWCKLKFIISWRTMASFCILFYEVVNYFKFRLIKDFRETGKCRVHIGKPIKNYGLCGLILRKGNIRKNSINQG
jgi:hypothetical protein